MQQDLLARRDDHEADARLRPRTTLAAAARSLAPPRARADERLLDRLPGGFAQRHHLIRLVRQRDFRLKRAHVEGVALLVYRVGSG
ncbi:MAG: hypothetical protein U0521_02815 [Anaerolineae bacterium]